MIEIPVNPVKPAMTFTVPEILERVKEQLTNDPNGYAKFIHDTAGILWRDDHRVTAMRLLRTFFPAGLKEVKEYCETCFK